MNIELPPPSEAAAAVIYMVKTFADSQAVAKNCTELSLHQHHSLNAAELGMATHILTRAALIHTTLQSAASYIAEFTPTPMPDAWQAVLRMALDLPVQFDTTEIRTS